MADARVNPDATLDFTRWSRPQHDGPPLRALTLLRWRGAFHGDAGLDPILREMILADIDFALVRLDQPSVDIWEEESGLHYFTQLIQSEALTEATGSLAGADAAREGACAAGARNLDARLDALWDAGGGIYRSRSSIANGDPRKALDIAAVLAILHADRKHGLHGVLDPKAQATLAKLEDLFGGRSSPSIAAASRRRSAAIRATPTTAAAPGMSRRSRRLNSTSGSRPRCRDGAELQRPERKRELPSPPRRARPAGGLRPGRGLP